MDTVSDIKPDIISMINDKQQATYNELRSFATLYGGGRGRT
jgi:hypothetical protein